MPPLILLFAGILGGATLVRLATRERQRVNRELEEARQSKLRENDPGPKLHRDPQTGAFRPG